MDSSVSECKRDNEILLVISVSESRKRMQSDETIYFSGYE